MHARPLPKPTLRWWLIFIVLLMAAGAVQGRGDERRLQSTLYDYAGTFRWGKIDQVLSFFDHAETAAKAPSTFELERWKQWRVVGYRAQPYALSKDGNAQQVVEIELSNINTQVTRTVIDRQRWRYERKSKIWLLTSGLPSLSQ